MKTEITDPAVIEALCQIQTRFVEAWNAAELNDCIGQTHDLPGGATYSGGGPARSASFILPDRMWLSIICKAPWEHWHGGRSFCRHAIAPEQVKRVVLRGSVDAFHQWLAAVHQDALEAPTLMERAMAGDATAAKQFLHEAGFTGPQYQSTPEPDDGEAVVIVGR